MHHFNKIYSIVQQRLCTTSGFVADNRNDEAVLQKGNYLCLIFSPNLLERFRNDLNTNRHDCSSNISIYSNNTKTTDTYIFNGELKKFHNEINYITHTEINYNYSELIH